MTRAMARAQEPTQSFLPALKRKRDEDLVGDRIAKHLKGYFAMALKAIEID